MGRHDSQKELFSYQVDLDRRVRADHPLRAVRREVDFSFVRTEVAHCYGYNGNESVDPVVILKLMFLLFFDDVKSERELLRTVPERLDYLWFLGYGLDDALPDHSVLSKARSRWGRDVFERLFVRTVGQCVQAGLVDGQKLHMDGSLIEANASRGSVVRSSPELIAQLKRAYGVEERKMEGHTSAPYYEPINASLCSTTDPDTACVRQNKNGPQGETRPRYKHHPANHTGSGQCMVHSKHRCERVERRGAVIGGPLPLDCPQIASRKPEYPSLQCQTMAATAHCTGLTP